MKIVINECYGGFGLSPKGLKRYLELNGMQAYFYIQSKYSFQDGVDEFKRVDDIEDIDTLFIYCTTYDQGDTVIDYPENVFYDDDIKRHDPILVQVVEELGEKASGKCAKLVIKEILNGALYRIAEYDGYESIEYRDTIGWEIAEDNENVD